MKTDPIRRRLDRLEAKCQPPVMSITWVITEPGENGPVPTGEIVTWHPGEPNPWQASHAPD